MRLSLITASDDNYAMALGVMVRSALENLRVGVGVDLYVLGDDLSLETQARLQASWEPFPIQTHWISPDSSVLQGRIQRRGHAGVPATYFRLLIDDLIPEAVERVIYLDVDMLIQGDLWELWEMDFQDAIALAVPDAYTEYFHRQRLEQADLPEELRFVKNSAYFNAGLLVIHLPAWRQHRIGERALEVATTFRELLAFHDQDALNLVLVGRWRALDPTWNLHELPPFLSAWEAGPYSRAQLRELFFSPKVVHFVSAEKPWTSRCYHFYHSVKFFETLSRTAWAGFAPEPLPWFSQLIEKLLILPNIRLNWCLWRGLIHTSSPRFLGLLGSILRNSPWVVFSYPLWLLFSRKPAVPEAGRSRP